MTNSNRLGPCSAPQCWQRASEVVGGVPLCQMHVCAVTEYLATARRAEDAEPEHKSVVYYISFDEGATVKIGTTTDPRSRFRELGKPRGACPRVIAAEPGGRELELKRHGQFDRLRQGRTEFFQNAPHLIAHMHGLIATRPGWRAELVDGLSDWRQNRRRRVA